MISRHKRIVELYNKEECCVTSAITTEQSSAITNENNQTGYSNNVHVKEEPCDDEMDNHQTLSNKLHSYKQIEKGYEICEMLFSHIPIADNSSTEEIYVSKVPESKASSNSLDDDLNHDKALDKSENHKEIKDCNISTSSSPDLSVCRMSDEDDYVERSSFEANKDEEKNTEPMINSSPQIQNLEDAENEHSFISRSSSPQSKHSIKEMKSRSEKPISSCDLVSIASDKSLIRSNTLVSENTATPNHKDNVSSESLDYSSKGSKIRENIAPKFSCHLCDRVFKDKRYLRRHLITHDGNMFPCLICCKAYSQKSCLDEHNKLKHSGKLKCKCTKCNKFFTCSQTLRRHQRNKHVSGEPAVDISSTCDVCTKTFKNKVNMLTHKRIQHSIEEEFICNECSKVFNHKQKLIDHMKLNHLPPTYKCKNCSALFNRLQQLNSHLQKVHAVEKEKPVICENCGKFFVNFSKLQIHMEKYSKENNCVCDECGKGFKSKVSLMQHLRSHSDVRRFSCEFCENMFKHKHHLKQHMAMHGMVSTPKYGRRGKRVVKQLSEPSSSGSATDQ